MKHIQLKIVQKKNINYFNSILNVFFFLHRAQYIDHNKLQHFCDKLLYIYINIYLSIYPSSCVLVNEYMCVHVCLFIVIHQHVISGCLQLGKLYINIDMIYIYLILHVIYLCTHTSVLQCVKMYTYFLLYMHLHTF